MIKKTKIKLYLRSFGLTAVILFCCSFAIWGTAKAYEGIRQVGFGDYSGAFDFENGILRLFDFEINLYEAFSEK